MASRVTTRASDPAGTVPMRMARSGVDHEAVPRRVFRPARPWKEDRFEEAAGRPARHGAAE